MNQIRTKSKSNPLTITLSDLIYKQNYFVSHIFISKVNVIFIRKMLNSAPVH
jgi:hypothetical protein